MKGRGVIQETLALFIVFCSAFLFLALISYDPSDPSFTHYVTSVDGVKNWGGILGAVLSDLLMKAFGLLSYGFTILIGTVAGLWLNGISPKGKTRWSVGVVLTALGLSVLMGEKAGALGSNLQKFVVSYTHRTGYWMVSLFLLSLAFRMLSGRHAFVLLKGTKGVPWTLLRKGVDLKRGKVLRSRWGRPPRIVMPSQEEHTAVSRLKEPSEEVKGDLTQERGSMGEKGWALPSLDMLEGGRKQKVSISEAQLWSTAQLLEHKLRDFGVEGKVVEVRPGPVVTVYEFEPAPGVKISKIVNLEDDLALALSAYSVRIEAPIPGKSVVGIEVSNPVRETVYLKDILASEAFKESPSKLTLALGKDIQGRPFVIDLTKMPHLLVAGSTGSGKSVSMNCMIMSILFRATPDEVKFLLIDPKMLEMSAYEDIPHLLLPVVTDPKEASSALRWVVREMEERYSLMASKGTKHIERYNQRLLAEGKKEELLPYIVVMIDELADLMITSRREVEESIIRLAQMARAAGIHLVLATQRPSVDVITGLIKANFPARISFQVSSKVDSRTILDTTGAEHLLGQGDMLFLPPGSSRLKRVHGAYVSEEEIKRVAEFWKRQGQPQYNLDILREEVKESDTLPDYDDPKYEEAVHYVIQTGQASVSALQRRFKIGYNRAARLIERMEREGIVGPSDGVRPRPVLVKRP